MPISTRLSESCAKRLIAPARARRNQAGRAASAGCVAAALVLALLATPAAQAQSAASVYNNAEQGLNAASNNDCGQGVTAALSAGQSWLSNAGNNVQNGITQPGNLNQESCIQSLLGNMQSAYQKLSSLFGGSGSLLGALEGFGSTLLNSAETQATNAFCGVANSQWNSASGQIDQIANLPNTVGQSITSGAGNIIGGSAGRTIGVLNGATGAATNPVQNTIGGATSVINNSSNTLLNSMF